MENYGSNYHYNYPQYPPPGLPDPNLPYPPPPPPPQLSQTYPYNSFNSLPTPTYPLNHSGHLQYPPPPPFPYPYTYPPPSAPSPPPPPPYISSQPSFPHPYQEPHPDSYHRQDSYLSSSSSSSSLYPTESLLADMSLSDHPPPRPDLYSHPNSSFGGSLQGPSLQMVPYASPSKGSSLKVVLLHGSLDIWVYDAKNLPNMDMFSKTVSDMLGPRLISGLSGRLEAHGRKSMTSDPYVTITVCDHAVIGRTFVISNSEEPVWEQHFFVPVAHKTPEVRFVVKDSDVVGAQFIGSVTIPAEQLVAGGRVDGLYPILGENGKPCKAGATLRLAIQFFPIGKLSMYNRGLGSGPDYKGVPGTYFPLRMGGRVTLYQDAHVPDGCLPDVRLEYGVSYHHGQCWRDIFDAITQARHMIYITGWSVYHLVKLVRDAGPQFDLTLGELLKRKSQEGVRVLLLVWDDPTSRSILGYKTDGLMQTHDEETRRFFKRSSVHVLLCPREAGKRHSFFKQKEVGAIYTHHQKTVIIDADAGNKRKIVAFVGGLDLCFGRYDTPRHPLFRTLKTVHKEDHHNPNFAVLEASDPREPWHDLHCKIDGPAAYDILKNFEERWNKASRRHGVEKLRRSFDDALLKLDRIPYIVGPGAHDSPYLNENDPEAWHVQIFRSIDSNSVKGFPKDPKEATSKNLVCGKNVLIDMSIHTAYVEAIRAAQHFIYIENQYFLGSSFNWDSNKDLGANNLIPMEIALKIANKIKAKERFAAYIVVPMWPEGNPTSMPTQRILFWQHKTMQMMYGTIYEALEEVGLHNTYEPQDYLNFFCLGNREGIDGIDTSHGGNSANTPNALARRNRRFMIYVHSKGMIVDDEYVILGSANINQRSMEGTRDSEIAMGAYQPQHTWDRKQSSPLGQIHGYRMSLWAEHTGVLEECFTRPETLDCVRRVRQMGEINWRQFASDDVTEMRGHLLKYPVDVDAKGKVSPLANCRTFLDMGGNICGSFFAVQENLTI
ncbi:Phospholipase D beta 1 [Acorus calamus]|uniref:phospholipase D n=1 Tax=Acorus calamus TaxID=4465 RepID=A0AAV9DS70_ACOCL|nr:Phospholipase D beta 1 [Acorus calamus]